MKSLSKLLLLLLATLTLASCGGGGGGSQSAFTPTPADTITISPAATSIPANSFTTVTVTVKKADGTIENDGVTVNAAVTPLTIGTISGSGQAGTTATNTLTGGKTSFVFNSSSQGGTATISISLPAGTNGSPTSASATQTITVTGGNGQDPRLQISASPSTLPLSPYSLAAQATTPFPGNFLGSPYISEVTLTFRRTNGQLFSGGNATVSISPASVAGLSLGSSATALQTIVSTGTVPIVGGVATVFVHAGNTPGTAVLTATATDPDTNQTITSQVQITVAGSGTTLPSSISVVAGGAVYISGSGGPQSTVISATVTNGSNALVADPNGFDNVTFEIVNPANSDARLSAVNAAGQTVTGTSVSTVTHNGIAAVTLQSGTQQGPVQVKVTADRGDNNVDNSIQDPVSATATVVISDGKLYNLVLTIPGPNAGALLINGVSTDASATVIPVDVNGTYSLTVSAKGEDRQGNPVIPGTQIRFGEIDGPLNGYTGTNAGQFAISGNDGNPQEGGTLFTAPTGKFTTAGGGAGPGDTVLVFGKAVPGNRDLENARTIQRVNNATSLNTTIAFNRNDDTGVSVDYGPVLPYVIGRGLDGSITASATTNDVGVATVKLTYPVSKLGKLAAVWAQGTGVPTGGATKTVDDIMFVRFAGVAGVGSLLASVTASPNPIFGNTTQQVRVCIEDALGSPLQGIQFNFAYSGTGTASVDGSPLTGELANLTDSSGCATATVVSSGVKPGTGTGTGGQLKFCAGDLCATVNVVVNIAVCQVSPSSVSVPSSGTSGSITITAFDSLGNKAAGITVTGTCTATGGTITPSSFTGVTNSQGVTVDPFVASGFVQLGTSTTPPIGGAGQCVYSAGGQVCGTVPFVGIPNSCDFSPPPPTCAQ